MAIELWFPVPIMVVEVEDAVRDATQAKVRDYLDSERGGRDVQPAPAESVKTSYFSQQSSILEDAKLTELKQAVLSAGAGFLQRLELPPIPLEIEKAWLNLFPPGAQENRHSHDGSVLSCSYYVEAPEKCGDLVFPDPVGARRSHRAFTQMQSPTFMGMLEVGFKPQPGRLIVFESWVEHYVGCNKSDKTRISLALNLRRQQNASA